MKDKLQPTPEGRMFRVRYPASGFGPLIYSVAGGYRLPGQEQRRWHKAPGTAPDLEEAPATTPDAAQPAPTVPPKKQRMRSVGTVKKALDDLLYNLTSPPTVECLFLLDERQWPWMEEQQEEEVPDFAFPERYWLLEDEPDLKAKVLHKLRDRFRYQYPQGWWFYRWFLTFTFGRPKLYLRLLGDPGTGKNSDIPTEEYLAKAWFSVTGSDDADLVKVHPPHEHSLPAFSAKPDPRTLPNLQRLLGGYVFGQFQKANMPKGKWVEEWLTEEEWERRRVPLIQHHLEHEGLLDAEGNPVPDAYLKSAQYRRLLAEGGRNFLNHATGPQFLAGRAEVAEGAGS